MGLASWMDCSGAILYHKDRKHGCVQCDKCSVHFDFLNGSFKIRNWPAASATIYRNSREPGCVRCDK